MKSSSIGDVLILKMHYIGKLEAGLSEIEITKRLKDISVEDKFFNIYIKDKKIYHVEFKENVVSFFYLSSVGVQDMLSPQMYIKIYERREGCICDLYYRKTLGFLYLIIWWNFLCGIYIYGSILKGNIFNTVCCIIVYALGIWAAVKHCINICKNVVDFLQDLLN